MKNEQNFKKPQQLNSSELKAAALKIATSADLRGEKYGVWNKHFIRCGEYVFRASTVFHWQCANR